MSAESKPKKGVRFRSGSPDTLIIPRRPRTKKKRNLHEQVEDMTIDEPGLERSTDPESDSSRYTPSLESLAPPMVTPNVSPTITSSMAQLPPTTPLHLLAPAWDSSTIPPATTAMPRTGTPPLPIMALAPAWNSPNAATSTTAPTCVPSPPNILTPLCDLAPAFESPKRREPRRLPARARATMQPPLFHIDAGGAGASAASIDVPVMPSPIAGPAGMARQEDGMYGAAGAGASSVPSSDLPAVGAVPGPERAARRAYERLRHLEGEFSAHYNTLRQEHPVVQFEVARRLAVILSEKHETYPPPLDRSRDAPIVAAYSHYANTLVDASVQMRLLLTRRQEISNRLALHLQQKAAQVDEDAETELDIDIL